MVSTEEKGSSKKRYSTAVASYPFPHSSNQTAPSAQQQQHSSPPRKRRKNKLKSQLKQAPAQQASSSCPPPSLDPESENITGTSIRTLNAPCCPASWPALVPPQPSDKPLADGDNNGELPRKESNGGHISESETSCPSSMDTNPSTANTSQEDHSETRDTAARPPHQQRSQSGVCDAEGTLDEPRPTSHDPSKEPDRATVTACPQAACIQATRAMHSIEAQNPQQVCHKPSSHRVETSRLSRWAARCPIQTDSAATTACPQATCTQVPRAMHSIEAHQSQQVCHKPSQRVVTSRLSRGGALCSESEIETHVSLPDAK